jgi:signal transduction histidine kinase
MSGAEVEIGDVVPAATAVEILNTQVGGMLVLSPDFRVLWVNDSVKAVAPRFGQGADVRGLLLELSEEQKVDRLLFNRERVLAPAEPDGPDLYWLMHPQQMDDGNLLLYLWDPDISEDLHDRRISFLAGAAHEIRSPLSVILGFAEILAMETGRLSESQREALEMIILNTRYLERLVADVMDLTRNSFGELPLDICPTDVAAVAREVRESIEPRVAEKGQTIDYSVDGEVPPIEADPDRVRQIIWNLVQNSNAHCPAGTSIAIACRLDANGEHVEVEVRDDGPGISFEDPADAFRSFASTGPQDPASMSGAGIGLSITKRLVQLHRGQILLDTGPDSGTRFTVRLPVDRHAAQPSYRPGPVGES